MTDKEKEIASIMPDDYVDPNHLAFLIEEGTQTSKKKVKMAIQQMAMERGYTSAEDMYADLLTLQMANQLDRIKLGEANNLNKGDDVLVKYLKEISEVMDWKEGTKQTTIESNIRPLTNSQLMNR